LSQLRRDYLVIIALVCAATLFAGFVSLCSKLRENTRFSETKLVLNNVAGAGFDVVETDSDMLAKEQFVSVYVYDSGSRSNWLKRLVHPRVLLFRYDPWNWEEPMPTIEADRPDHIRISIPRVSSILFQKRQFKRIDVDYAVGFVEYK
jgi:hypothetical protein